MSINPGALGQLWREGDGATIRRCWAIGVGLEPAAECPLSPIVSDSTDADQPSMTSQESGT